MNKMKEQTIDRRGFLAGLGLGALALSSSGTLSSCTNLSSGGLMISNKKYSELYPIYKNGKYLPKDFSRLLKDSELGLSPEIIENHLGLYKNYIRKVNAAEAASIAGESPSEATLKNLAFSLNGMALHDIYFSNMRSGSSTRSSALNRAIEDTFGNFDNYMDNLIQTAEAVEGWSLTCVNLLNGKIFNYGEDNHSNNFPNFVVPILALDVYEHAYEMDLGKSPKAKSEYIEIFRRIIDWDMVSRRLDALSASF